MCRYASSRVKRKSFYRRCFFLFPAAISVHQNGTPTWCLHTKLYKGTWNVSANNSNNSETVGHKDLRLGQIVYTLVFYNILFSLLLPLNGFQFNFFVAWQWKRSKKFGNLFPDSSLTVLYTGAQIKMASTLTDKGVAIHQLITDFRR